MISALSTTTASIMTTACIAATSPIIATAIDTGIAAINIITIAILEIIAKLKQVGSTEVVAI